MRIRRISLVLPASRKDTATHDARAIAEAVAKGIREAGSAPMTALSIAADGRNAGSIALETSREIRFGTAAPKTGNM